MGKRRTGFRVFPYSVVIQEGRGDRFRRAVFTSEEHRAVLLKMSLKVRVSGKGQVSSWTCGWCPQ